VEQVGKEDGEEDEVEDGEEDVEEDEEEETAEPPVPIARYVPLLVGSCCSVAHSTAYNLNRAKQSFRDNIPWDVICIAVVEVTLVVTWYV
jgi:hypothetical protein